ncbi:hypothetical protein G8764_01510 [Pseudomaricurvus alcaniphilus]|uniref:cell division inhibitor SulA n=1 Tax=Pseudomaricurvus alcaniphilus TaxID=1166482 RepID=UPI001408DB8A|nr:hypothetical protein [Pseudomaricurvus alcaniphilus]NHN35968.1 hypothetical protein [Pseudomaricurvus alcaniphilus]
MAIALDTRSNTSTGNAGASRGREQGRTRGREFRQKPGLKLSAKLTSKLTSSRSADYTASPKQAPAQDRGQSQPQSQPQRQPKKTSSITELVFTRHSSDKNLLLLPMIAHLSRIADRWISWITTTAIDAQQLQEFGVDTTKIRVIHANSEDDQRWILWEALHNGTSHTVVAFPDTFSKDDMAHFEHAARQGCSSGLIIRYR